MKVRETVHYCSNQTGLHHKVILQKEDIDRSHILGLLLVFHIHVLVQDKSTLQSYDDNDNIPPKNMQSFSIYLGWSYI